MDKKFSFCSNEGNRTHSKNWNDLEDHDQNSRSYRGKGRVIENFRELQHISSDNVKRPQIKTEIQTVA